MDTEILNLLTYLIIYSFFGWILESVSKSIWQKELVNSGFLHGPICPIYGFGAVIMIVCLESLKDNIFLLFIVAFFVLSIWEYVVGILLEKIFKTKYWDYSDLKFNIQGRLCLKNSIYWGVLGVIFIKYIHPYVASQIVFIPKDVLIYSNIVIYIAFIIDTITTSIKTIKLDKAIAKVNEIETKIKEQIRELKKLRTRNREANNLSELENIIKELQITQTKLKIQLYKTTKRLKAAFPSMKSEEISNFLNQKIDLKALKEYIKRKQSIRKQEK